MRILIDARVLQDRYHGIARYTSELITALAARCDHELLLLATDAPASRISAEDHRRDGRLIRFDAPVVSLTEQRRWPGSLRRINPDVLFVPYHLATPWFHGSVPTVTVIHDTIFEDGGSPPPTPAARLLYRRATGMALRTADSVLTVSHATRERVAFHYGHEIPPDHVIHHGVDPRFGRATQSDIDVTRARLQLPPNYYLHLGARRPHKNVRVLIEAFRGVADRLPSLHLVLAGPSDDRFDDPVPDMIRRSGLSGRVILVEDVPERDVVGLLSGAFAFVFPSTIEGFGLPVLESLAAGVPVIASTAPAVLEASCGAAITVPPDDVDGWSKAMLTVVGDRELRGELIARGREVARNQTWGTAADAIDGVLRRTVEQRGRAATAAPRREEPAIGAAGPMHTRERRRRVVALGLVVLVALVLAVGRLTRDPTTTLGTPSAAWVVEGSVLRSGQPRDIDFANMRDILNVTGVINLRTDLTGERLIIEGFSMRYLHVPVRGGGVPTIADLEVMTAFLREHTPDGPVLIHDEFGDGSAPAVGAALAVLHGVEPRVAIRSAQSEETGARLTVSQIALVSDLGAQLGRSPIVVGQAAATVKSPVKVPQDVNHLIW